MKWLLLALLLAGCSLVPARVPPQLEHTPGPAVRFSEGRVLVGTFAVPIPPAWRVVKSSTAQEPLRVVLAAPDDAVLITAALSERILDNPALPVRHEQTLQRDGQTLYLIGQATDEAAPLLAALWPRLIDDLETP